MPGQMLYYPASQLPKPEIREENQMGHLNSQVNPTQRGHEASYGSRDFANMSGTMQNRNMSTLGYSTIEPIAQKEYLSLEGTFPIPGTFTSKDFQHIDTAARSHSQRANFDQGSQMGFTGLFGPQDFQQPQPGTSNLDYKQLTAASNHNEHRVNFRDRYTQAGTMDTRYDDRINEADLSHRDGRNQSNLKSSMKYSKPPCLQNTSAMGLSMTGKAHASMVAPNRTALGYGDHDDLKLKLERLAQKFLEKNKEKDGFKDTFFDEEIFDEELKARNYFKLSLDLLKYALHSANLPKKKKEEKKAGSSLGVRR